MSYGMFEITQVLACNAMKCNDTLLIYGETNSQCGHVWSTALNNMDKTDQAIAMCFFIRTHVLVISNIRYDI